MSKKELGIFIVCVIIILFPALYNGYPLVTSDSGAYIENAFKLYVPDDRSMVYSVFVRLASMSFSLWGVVIAQAVLLVFFIRLLVKHFCKGLHTGFLLTAISLCLTIFTSAGWFCGQLMADIFTGILLLAICTLFFVPFKHKWSVALLLVFIWACIIMHNSHLLIGLVFSVFMVLYYWFTRNKDLFRKSLMLFGLSIADFLTLSTMNAISGKGFRPSSSSHVFLMARLAENGILDQFLRENCATGEYKLCAYREQIPDRSFQFIWDPNSPLYKTGGWKANEAEYSKIIRKTLTKPEYLRLHIFRSIQATCRQLAVFNIGDANVPQMEGSIPFARINTYFFNELKEYRSTLQNNNSLGLDFFSEIILLFAFISIGVTLLLLAYPGAQASLTTEWKALFFVVIAFLIANAFVSATFSSVVGRYQSRVFWVLPFICILFLAGLMKRREYNSQL